MNKKSTTLFVATMIDQTKNLLLKIPILFASSIWCLSHSCHGICDSFDRASLSSFNLTLTASPPLRWYSPWIDCCFWEGITCDASGKVTNLSLPSRGMHGTLPPSIGNLTALVELNFSHNWLTGPLRPSFFRSLNQARVIDLSHNRLCGELDNIPPELRVLNLSSNHFRGRIEVALFRESVSLEAVDVNNNSFSGEFPAGICDLARGIQRLDFSNNEFSGEIPPGLDGCGELRSLRAGFGGFSGGIPSDVYQLRELEELYLPGNRFSGTINRGILNLTNLKTLALFGNELTGRIPAEIGNLKRLEMLELHINRFRGEIPATLANCTNLTLLNLRVNFLEGELSSFDFSGIVRLKTVDLGNNLFSGGLPSSLFSCRTLTAVRLSANRLSGEFIPEISSLPFLSFLSVSNNSLTNLTTAIGILSGCRSLTALMLAKNFYNESFPHYNRLTGFQNLQVLGFGGCDLTGRVPVWLKNLYKLQVIDLSYNKLTGLVPSWLGSLPNLFYIDLSYNHLTGSFPIELAKIQRLSIRSNDVPSSYLELPVFIQPDNASDRQYNQLSNLPSAIYLGHNRIIGAIPSEIGQLKYIITLDLSCNEFSGTIPNTISYLTNLEKLDLSRNNLTGEIPASLQNLNFLSSFSVAYNSLVGLVPEGGQFGTFPSQSFEGNDELCGPILQRSCTNSQSSNRTRSESQSENDNGRKRTIMLTLVTSSAAFVLILLLYFFVLTRRVSLRKSDENDLESISFNTSGVFPEFPKETELVVHFTNKTLDLTVADILSATDNFNQANIIGCGGFGLVFKANLSDGTYLAIKKLSGDMGLMEKEFKAEIEALSTARHKNLVTLQGYCLHDGHRLLIYDYMENGSLDYWLHERPDGPSILDWGIRVKILQGTSRGVAYMHETCDPHIVHRDLKSSNILLDRDFEARVADFGLARLILPYETHVTTELVGTLGYIPPEYSQSWIATLRGDMYSFGVVMLELLSGKRPVEMFRPKASRELVAWAKEMRGEGKEEEVFDVVLRGKGFEKEMGRVLDVACMCVSESPSSRPTIKEVEGWLGALQNKFSTIE